MNRNWPAERRRPRCRALASPKTISGDLPPNSKRDVLQGLRGIAHDRFAGTDLPGERDLANAGMPRQQAAGIGETLYHLKHAGRRPGLQQDLLQFDGGERRQFGGLEYHGIAAGERRRGFPAGDLQRIVPGADAGDHAERFTPRVAEGLGP